MLFEFHGEHFDLAGRVTPAALTRPRPPIWMGAHAPAGLERAARLADMWLCDPERDIDTAARLAEQYRKEAARSGQARARRALPRGVDRRLPRGVRAGLGRRTPCRSTASYYNVGVYLEEFEPWVTEVADRADFTLQRLAPDRFLYGSPEEVRETVVGLVPAHGRGVHGAAHAPPRRAGTRGDDDRDRAATARRSSAPSAPGPTPDERPARAGWSVAPGRRGPHMLAGLLERGFDVTLFHTGRHEIEGQPDVAAPAR